MSYGSTATPNEHTGLGWETQSRKHNSLKVSQSISAILTFAISVITLALGLISDKQPDLKSAFICSFLAWITSACITLATFYQYLNLILLRSPLTLFCLVIFHLSLASKGLFKWSAVPPSLTILAAITLPPGKTSDAFIIAFLGHFLPQPQLRGFEVYLQEIEREWKNRNCGA